MLQELTEEIQKVKVTQIEMNGSSSEASKNKDSFNAGDIKGFLDLPRSLSSPVSNEKIYKHTSCSKALSITYPSRELGIF